MKLRTFFITLIILLVLLFTTITIVIKTAVSSGFYDSILAEFTPNPEPQYENDSDYDDSYYEEYDQETETGEDFYRIHIDVKALSIRIVPGDEFDVSYYGDDELEPEIYFVGDCLNVIQNNNTKINGTKDSPKLTITLGSGMFMDDIDIKADIGDIFIDDLFIDNLSINTDLGNINIHALNFLNCEVNADLGNIVFDESYLYGSLDINADYGNIEIHDLYGIDDAAIDAKCELGTLKIHTDTFNHTGQSFYNSSDGPSLTINAEVGNIEID